MVKYLICDPTFVRSVPIFSLHLIFNGLYQAFIRDTEGDYNNRPFVTSPATYQVDSGFIGLFVFHENMLKHLPEGTYFVFEADKLINVTYEFADAEAEEEQRTFIEFMYKGEYFTLVL